MKRFLSIIMMMFFMSVSVIQVDAKIYKWRDENGKLHFTDDPSKIPAKKSKSLDIDSKSNKEKSTPQKTKKRVERSSEGGCEGFASTFVKTVNKKERAGWEGLIHPKVQSCITSQKEYFDYVSKKDMRRTIPSDYKVKCEKKAPSEAIPFEEAFTERMTYPIRPNHTVILDYKTGPNSGVTTFLQVLEKRGKWFYIIPCLTDFGLKEFREKNSRKKNEV